MRSTDNAVWLSGEVAVAPVLRYTAAGVPNARFVIRTWRSVRSREVEGERVDLSSTFVVIVWAELAKLLVQTLKVDDPVTISGELRSRTYETEDRGVVNEVEILALHLSKPLQSNDTKE